MRSSSRAGQGLRRLRQPAPLRCSQRGDGDHYRGGGQDAAAWYVPRTTRLQEPVLGRVMETPGGHGAA